MIEPELGKNIEEPFEDAEHSKSALKIFKDLPVVGHLKLAGDSDAQSTRSSENMGGGIETGGFIGDSKNKSEAAGLDGEEIKSTFTFDYSKGLW